MCRSCAPTTRKLRRRVANSAKREIKTNKKNAETGERARRFALAVRLDHFPTQGWLSPRENS